MKQKGAILASLKNLAVLAAIAGLLSWTGCDRQQQQPAASKGARPAPEVTVTTIEARQVTLTTDLPGRTAPFRIAEIRPQVSGLILNRFFQEGSDVEAGQVLYEIDPAPFQAALDYAKASLAAAQNSARRARAGLNASLAGMERQQAALDLALKNRDRFEKSFKERAVSASQRDKAVTEARMAETALEAAKSQLESDQAAIAAADASIQQAQASVKTARINLAFTRITAPISGRIGKSNVTEGAIVTAYQPVPMAVIQQLDPIYVDVPQSTSELLRLRRQLDSGKIDSDHANQNQVKLLLEDGSEYPETGALKFSDVTVDPTTGSVILRIVFPNPEGVLLPGMYVRGIVKEGVMDQAILAPQQGVSRNHMGEPISMVVNKAGQVEMRLLKLDKAIGDKWLVSGGLAPGDKVIMEGVQKVRPGMQVKFSQFGAPGANSEKSGGQAKPAHQ